MMNILFILFVTCCGHVMSLVYVLEYKPSVKLLTIKKTN